MADETLVDDRQILDDLTSLQTSTEGLDNNVETVSVTIQPTNTPDDPSLQDSYNQTAVSTTLPEGSILQDVTVLPELSPTSASTLSTTTLLNTINDTTGSETESAISNADNDTSSSNETENSLTTFEASTSTTETQPQATVGSSVDVNGAPTTTVSETSLTTEEASTSEPNTATETIVDTAINTTQTTETGTDNPEQASLADNTPIVEEPKIGGDAEPGLGTPSGYFDPKTLIDTVVEEIVDTTTVLGETSTTSEYTDQTTRTNDLDNNQELVSITRYWTDTSTTPTTVTTTTTLKYTYTYYDGTTSTEIVPVSTIDNTTTDTVVTNREEILYVGTEEPSVLVEYINDVSTVVGETSTTSTYNDETTRDIKLESNTEQVTITRYWTDSSTTPTTITTTVTPKYTYTYSDGTTEVEYGTPTVTSETTTNTVVNNREEILYVGTEEPQVAVEYITETTSVTGNTTTTSTYNDEIVRTNDLINNKENVVTTRYWTDTNETPTTTTTTVTPKYTYTYSDGTTEVEYGNVQSNDVVTIDTQVTNRNQVIYQGTENPTIVTDYLTNTTINVLDPVTITTLVDTIIETTTDDDKDEITTTTTNNYLDTTTTDTVTSTTTTPRYTITYTDGTVEVEYGDSVTDNVTTTDTTTSTHQTVDIVVTEDPDIDTPPEPVHQDNGWGNGDDTAPGNSGNNNNAENNTPSQLNDTLLDDITLLDTAFNSNTTGGWTDVTETTTPDNTGGWTDVVEQPTTTPTEVTPDTLPPVIHTNDFLFGNAPEHSNAGGNDFAGHGHGNGNDKGIG